ncbi:MAG TPA: TraB/GumN family protein [Gemmatimonadaceae bacterium]|nr:TraB/GumN family protein [Gemmatimonadaceae bacterium]
MSTRRQFIRGTFATGACFLFEASPALAILTSQRPLWTARKQGREVYLVGETWPQPNDWHDPVIETLLRTCGHLWTETNQIYRRPTKELVEQYGASPDASPLKLLSHAQMARLHKAADACDVSLKDLAGMRPWVIGATLEDAFYQKEGLRGKSAREILLARADSAGIPVSCEFAAKDDVFVYMGGLSPIEDAQFLYYELDGVLLGRTGSERISSNWLAGHTGPAAAFVDHERRAYPELYVKLTVDRNRGWVPRFESMMLDEKPTMVVVGMFHLVGQDSVLSQLRHAGYEVAQTNPE